ncbi:hypothetical protein SCHPADRAFT_944511 [Schizopora paradoxa]|uniref:Threonine/serine exporter-like N-terminal domain-containing protein n=1 Tax=Schizopora paradoxa TaxID=27342 RepID=A0A0H2RFP5_9AGAM|nr:hypothetical protein SCHPADRAFT_944511 [Schizopora paradoxa]
MTSNTELRNRHEGSREANIRQNYTDARHAENIPDISGPWKEEKACDCSSPSSDPNVHTVEKELNSAWPPANGDGASPLASDRGETHGFLYSTILHPISNYFMALWRKPEPIPCTISQLLVQAATTASAPLCPIAATMRPMASHKKSRINFYRTDFPSQKELYQNQLNKKKPRKSDVYKRMHKQTFRANCGTYEENRDFVLTFATALMRYGAPPHRIQSAIENAGRCVGLSVTCCFIAVVSFISIRDPETDVHQLKIIKQPLGFDLDRSLKTHRIYLRVYRDEISPKEGTAALSDLLGRPARYTWWQVSLWAAFCSFTVCPIVFSGSALDMAICFPLGFAVTALEYIPGNTLYINIYEVLTTAVTAFIAAALASTKRVCYSAVLTSSIVWLLPGYTLTLGALEITSVQSMLTGAARVVFVVIFAISLGLGITMGTSLYALIDTSFENFVADYKCVDVHDVNGPWWQRQVNPWFGFIIAPLCAAGYLSRMHLTPKQEVFHVGLFIACAAFGVGTILPILIPNQPNICYALEAFIVGLLANIYGKYFHGAPYIVMVVATIFLVPSALKVGNGGLYVSVSQEIHGQAADSYLSGFQIAMTMVSLSISLAVGLCLSVFLIHPNHASRRKLGLAFSF